MKELIEIQTRLVAPKNQTNDFGHYKYRSLEGIMEAAKPLLKEYGCTITFTDSLVMLGDRIFCQSTATLKNTNGETEQSTSFAELDSHKGMSKEQSSGSSSSYARKYAICSLLAIDDNQDVDSMDNTGTATPQDNTTVLVTWKDRMKTVPGIDLENLKKFYTYYYPKMGDWHNTFDPDKMWQKWQERAK